MSDDTAPEEWRVIPGFPDYEVSDLGRVRSFRCSPEPRMLKPSDHKGVYLKVSLVDADDKVRTRLVHNLVLRAFVGPTPVGLETCHNNGKGSSNRLANLRYDTHSNNSLDRRRHGTMRPRRPPLTDEQAEAIRAMYATGEFTINKLADKNRADWRVIQRVVTTKGAIDWLALGPRWTVSALSEAVG